jgi:hypothetical protein
MSPWFPWEEPLVIDARTKDDVLFGLKRFRYVANYYAEVMGAASVLRSSPQEHDDATGKALRTTHRRRVA